MGPLALWPSSLGEMRPMLTTMLTNANVAGPDHNLSGLILLVPGEGIEPPTNGLQNRCSTAELTRQDAGIKLV